MYMKNSYFIIFDQNENIDINNLYIETPILEILVQYS